ncbi:hypothetical protein ASE00_06325 [Sphingomonas sp. Root710]|uniref:hypothetical protein n=1 Tax=Sphingomonas sp. Root710 TaxID=1736594 RepID=UPI0007007053|nr:hypothetical protein [Sphingomonas sp. Root710]KRB86906.1 hypothetical protein ASE00_06325 [Sphingomonas sp. Root710]
MRKSVRPAGSRSLLIATNHLQHIAGSEVVALELAQHFQALGCNVTTFANWVGRPMSALIESVTGAPPITDPARIRPFAYDIVYAQHQVLGLFDYGPSDRDRSDTRIIIGRLSRRVFLESGAWLHDRLLADHVLANSALTAEHLVAMGHDGPITSFLNAAPAGFFRPFIAKPPSPRRALVVTNHADPALMEAIGLLRQNMSVHHVGHGGDEVTLITPQMIADADVVISIGKTVPYALVSRVPVYIYDHFGGPGYLDRINVDMAARFNFTGRCCGRRLSGAQIAAEIIGNYAKGVAFARDMPQAWVDRYSLPRYLDLLLEPPLMSNAAKRQRMREHRFLIQERQMAAYMRWSYIKRQQLTQEISVLKNDRSVRPS